MGGPGRLLHLEPGLALGGPEVKLINSRVFERELRVVLKLVSMFSFVLFILKTVHGTETVETRLPLMTSLGDLD